MVNHLELVNLVERIRHDTANIQMFFQDPVIGFNGLVAYGANLQVLVEVMTEMLTKFETIITQHEATLR